MVQLKRQRCVPAFGCHIECRQYNWDGFECGAHASSIRAFNPYCGFSDLPSKHKCAVQIEYLQFHCGENEVFLPRGIRWETTFHHSKLCALLRNLRRFSCFLWRHLRFLFGSELCLIYIVHIVGLIFVCSEILPSRNLALVFCPGLMSFGFRWMPLLLFQDIFPELLQVCIWKDHVQSLLGRTSVLGSIHATFFWFRHGF